MNESILFVAEDVLNELSGNLYWIGDLVFTSNRVIFLTRSFFNTESETQDYANYAYGLAGVLIESIQQEINLSKQQKEAILHAEMDRTRDYGLKIDARQPLWSFDVNPANVINLSTDLSSLEITNEIERKKIYFIKKPSDVLYNIIRSWPDVKNNKDYENDPLGFNLSFKSPTELVKEAMNGVLNIDGSTSEAMALNLKYMTAIGLNISSLEIQQRLIVCQTFVKCSRSFRMALLNHLKFSKEDIIGYVKGAIVSGLFSIGFFGVFAVLYNVDKEADANWFF
jgi:hypothetical protein